eukprot:TRINITY_DN22223_c0_g1_i1.p1 TRINITY_DN22223_c0_g1~~TRINITY_DN22223_c0_g1_i1.p1  ORF type:complete len:717 (+),score=88.70 TRINITY_DN22223_c0_g1_i1:74-2224(+)
MVQAPSFGHHRSAALAVGVLLNVEVITAMRQSSKVDLPSSTKDSYWADPSVTPEPATSCRKRLKSDYHIHPVKWIAANMNPGRPVEKQVEYCASWCQEESECMSFAVWWQSGKVEDYNNAYCYLCSSEDADDHPHDGYVWYGKPTKAEMCEDGPCMSVSDGEQSILANFSEDEGKGLWFGVATAAAHVEETYENDPWVDFAHEGKVAAYNNSVSGPYPDDRLNFWSKPEEEIDLAAGTGSKVFRMGVEWGRLTKFKSYGVTDLEAMDRYVEIARMVKARNMSLMMTLFHHSMPKWASSMGGWGNAEMVHYFFSFAQRVAHAFGDLVDFWVPFNEAHVFVMLSGCTGAWPPGIDPKPSAIQGAACVTNPFGVYATSVKHIAEAHNKFHRWIHDLHQSINKARPRVGIAHNIGYMQGHNLLGNIVNRVNEKAVHMTFGLIDQVKEHLDWLGLNYYGRELLTEKGPIVAPDHEYSESGRAVYPQGLYILLKRFHARYNFTSYIITENGISDSTDILRPAYVTEHLLAVRQAQREGVPVEGYIHWTVSDNWEWADGYCPKFGLVAVDRSTRNFNRTKRPFYDTFKEIVRSKIITMKQRDDSWAIVQNAALRHTERPFCRDETSDDPSLGLDVPAMRKVVPVDWRFRGLSQEENGCFFTPWRSMDVRAVAMPDASCVTIKVCDPSQKGLEGVWLARELRCPGAITAIKKRRVDCTCNMLAP